MTAFPILIDWKSNSYNAILFIIECLIKMIYYDLVKTIINVASLVEVIIDMIIRYHSLLELIISDQNLVFTSEF